MSDLSALDVARADAKAETIANILDALDLCEHHDDCAGVDGGGMCDCWQSVIYDRAHRELFGDDTIRELQAIAYNAGFVDAQKQAVTNGGAA